MTITETKDFMNLKFENFVDTLDGEDLFDKTSRLDEILSSGIMTGNEALGMVTMNKVQPDSEIKENLLQENKLAETSEENYEKSSGIGGFFKKFLGDKNKDKYRAINLNYSYSNSNYQTKDKTSNSEEVLIVNY